MPALKKIEVNRNLPITSFLRVFNVLVDEDGQPFVNIFRTATLDDTAKVNPFLYITVTSNQEEFWDNMAFKYYENPNIWWTIALANDVVNPFEELDGGESVKIIKGSYIYNLFSDIMRQEQL